MPGFILTEHYVSRHQSTFTHFQPVIHTGGSPIKYKTKGVIEIPSQPREARTFNGVNYIMEEGITGDYALIKAR